MSELKYKRVPTTASVYHTIVQTHFNKVHSEITVYESYTNIVENGVCTIYTVWGLKSAEVALVGAKTKYETELSGYKDGEFFSKEIEGTRTNEYWLCAPYIEIEEDEE